MSPRVATACVRGRGWMRWRVVWRTGTVDQSGSVGCGAGAAFADFFPDDFLRGRLFFFFFAAGSSGFGFGFGFSASSAALLSSSSSSCSSACCCFCCFCCFFAFFFDLFDGFCFCVADLPPPQATNKITSTAQQKAGGRPAGRNTRTNANVKRGPCTHPRAQRI